MALGFSRRDFIKLGTFGSITVMFGRLPTAQTTEVHSGPQTTEWMAADGQVKYHRECIDPRDWHTFLQTARDTHQN